MVSNIQGLLQTDWNLSDTLPSKKMCCASSAIISHWRKNLLNFVRIISLNWNMVFAAFKSQLKVSQVRHRCWRPYGGSGVRSESRRPTEVPYTSRWKCWYHARSKSRWWLPSGDSRLPVCDRVAQIFKVLEERSVKRLL